jgi:hypothetical protein
VLTTVAGVAKAVAFDSGSGSALSPSMVARVTQTDESGAHFLNVDLEILSDDSLDHFLAAMRPRVDELHNHKTDEGYFLVLELSGITSDANSTISALVALIQNLSPQARAAWTEHPDVPLTSEYRLASTPTRSARFFNPPRLKRSPASGLGSPSRLTRLSRCLSIRDAP